MNAVMKQEAMLVAGGLFGWNAPNAIGYLFCERKDGKGIATGMFCDRVEEIDSELWDWFLLLKNLGRGQFFNITKPKSFTRLNNLLGGTNARSN
ncbi:MAG: hypothetical protein D4S01_03015 [Dehalococcoidia bacterium]|nr:MAG: hypothetical protein D4S01_03015 [Dehalococcoidia bacterium]